jgi:hypothetical protein
MNHSKHMKIKIHFYCILMMFHFYQRNVNVSKIEMSPYKLFFKLIKIFFLDLIVEQVIGRFERECIYESVLN